MAKNIRKPAKPAVVPVEKKTRKPRAKKAAMTATTPEVVPAPVAEVAIPVEEKVTVPVQEDAKASKYQMIAVGVFIVAYFALLFSYLL